MECIRSLILSRLRHFVLLFLLFVFKIGYSCDCQSTSIQDRFHSCEEIFYGEILENSEIKVLERFKGKQTKYKYDVQNLACKLKPKVGEHWLVYSVFHNGALLMSYCSGSRHVELSLTKNYPPPPGNHKYGNETQMIYKLQEEINNLKEIEVLRSLKRSNESETHSFCSCCNTIWFSLVIVIIIFFIYLWKNR